ncbi:MAG TPA: c-type cytochrome [Terracidiphilus sp.]|jgi:cytochrome c oxidase cbb3-type subunit 3/ubiquinol-cytochrome c reductase cytochrome c subunit
MKPRPICACVLALAISSLAGCDLPGRPKPGPEVPRPETIASFDTLYGDNCAGCHGKSGEHGAATDLANPEYEALIDDASLRDVISNGEKETLMPAFASHRGGPLTAAQIEVIVEGMRARWKKDKVFTGDNPPPYKAAHAGDASKGQAVYAAACARCHGANAQQHGNAGSILDGSFLALVNEQTIRTTILAGRPDIGEPDWRGHIPGRPMTDDEITDVSAWLIAQRPASPGQPYTSEGPTTGLPAEAQPQSTKPNRQ